MQPCCWSSDRKGLDRAGLPVPRVAHASGLHEKACFKTRCLRPVRAQVGAQYQLFVFLGRLTHQKGGDLIAAAAKAVLASSSVAQARLPNTQIKSSSCVFLGCIAKKRAAGTASRPGFGECFSCMHAISERWHLP